MKVDIFGMRKPIVDMRVDIVGTRKPMVGMPSSLRTRASVPAENICGLTSKMEKA